MNTTSSEEPEEAPRAGVVRRGVPSARHAAAGALRLLRSRTRPLVAALLTMCALLAVLSVLGMVVGWWRMDVVLSGSMSPTMRPGDVVVAVQEPDSQVQVGQVLAFHPPNDPQIVVVHRVVQVIHRQGKVAIRTQGDSNNAPDQWTAWLQGSSAWRVTWVMPAVGYVAIDATYPWVRILALVVIVLVLMEEGLRRIWFHAARGA